MPIDEMKVKDLLANRLSYKVNIQTEIDTYESFRKNPQFENGLLTYIADASYGDMLELVKDLEIVPEKLEFLNIGDL